MINNKRIKETYIEDIIFIIYYLLISLSLIANRFERSFLLNNNNQDKEIYRTILLIIFIIAICIYSYYVYDSYNTYKNETNLNIKSLEELSLFASILILISGIIYLYIIIIDKDASVELAFT